MSIIPPGKVLVKAGKFKGGKLPIVNYVGQIKPADMPAILWWGDFGNDGTGTGSISAPFLTFPAALAAFSTTAHKWILKTDLTVYGESEPAAYIDDPADRVYLDPTRPDDSGDGLTSATAKKTYAAAKTVLGSSGRSAIHCIGSFTLTDLIDARIQGEAGATLTYLKLADYSVQQVYSGTIQNFVQGIQAPDGTLIALANNDGTSGSRILRSADGGLTWAETFGGNPWVVGGATTRTVSGIAQNGTTMIISGKAPGGGATGNEVLRSTDGGIFWNRVATVAPAFVNYRGVCWTGSNYVIFGEDNVAPFNRLIRTSPDGITWTDRAHGIAVTHGVYQIASDGNGNVMIVGRKTATTALMFYSTDHGVTWTDYSALIGVGINTGGAICVGVEFRNGYWWIFQDTISPAVYYSNTPTVAWSSLSDTVMMPFVNGDAVFNGNGQGVRLGYSSLRGGFVYPPTTSIAPEIDVINASGSNALLNATGANYDNFASLVYSRNGSEYALFFGRDNSNVGKIFRMSLSETNIRAHAANLVMDVSIPAKLMFGVTGANIRSEPTAGISCESESQAQILRCRMVSADATALLCRGEIVKVSRNLIKSPTDALTVNGKTVLQDDIAVTQNLIAGNVLLNNTGGTDKELIQDNIIEGNFTAAALVTVKSNIRGAVVNTSALSKISTINPLFVDTTDYLLSRVALGQAFDSPLADRSAIFSYVYNAITYKDDLGPYRAFVALVETTYKRSFLLPKFSGNALSEDIENSASLLKSINGVPDVANRPSARLEIKAWASKTVDGQVREFVSFMEKERNTACALFTDFDETILDDIVVNGAHTSGTFEVNIVPKDIPVGTVMSISGVIRYVIQRYPRSGEASKLVLDEVLIGGLANGQLITVEQVEGEGEFLFVPEKRRQNTRVFSRRRDTYSGMRYQFVRKAM